MSRRKNFLLLTAVVFLCVFALTGCGEKTVLGDRQFSSGARKITAVISADEAAKLEEFPKLKFADLSGSKCYEEILNFRQAHPEIDLVYTVELPDGTVVDNSTTSLFLSKEASQAAEETAEAIQYLPELVELELNHDNLTNLKAIYSISSLRPDMSYNCDILVNGSPVSQSDVSLKMHGLNEAGAGELLYALPAMSQLKTVDLGSSAESPELSFEQIHEFQTLRPDVEFLYDFELFGIPFSLSDTEMNLNHIPMDDQGEMVKNAVSCMPKLKFLDMDSCGVSDEAMASIRDQFPDVKVVWRVWFGDNYSVRTDVEKILASKPSVGGNLNGTNSQALMYCTDVKYIDLGHNEVLPDISFVANMPKLEVAILPMSTYSDISPLAGCTELEYLEIQSTNVYDLSPLSGLKKLKHLNIGNLPFLNDISPLYELPQLERLWIGSIDPVPQEQIEKMQSIAPECEINTTAYDPTDGGWRYRANKTGLDPRYEKLMEQFQYQKGNAAYSFSWNDPMY